MASFTETIRPSSTSSISNPAIVVGASTAHEALDDVTPDDDSTLITGLTEGSEYAQLGLSNPSATSGKITSVKLYVRGRSVDGVVSFWSAIITNSTEYSGPSSSSLSWTTVSQEWTTNPNTGQAWTWAEINALEAKAYVRGTSETGPSYLTQVYVEVLYRTIGSFLIMF